MQADDFNLEDLEKALKPERRESLFERMVPEEVKRRFQTFDDAKQALIDNPMDYEAALFMFWDIYNPEVPPQLTARGDLAQTLGSLIANVHQGQQPDVYMHFTSALYTVEKRLAAITPNSVSLEENTELLENVLDSFRRESGHIMLGLNTYARSLCLPLIGS